MQEAFVATLLIIAKKHLEGEDDSRSRGQYGENDDHHGGGDDLDEYELWRVMKEQVKMLRDEMGSSDSISTGIKNTQAKPTPPLVAAGPVRQHIPWTREAPIRSRQSAGAGRVRGNRPMSQTAQTRWAVPVLQQANEGVANGICAGNTIPELEQRAPQRAETASDVMLGTLKVEDYNTASFQWTA